MRDTAFISIRTTIKLRNAFQRAVKRKNTTVSNVCLIALLSLLSEEEKVDLQ